MPAAMEWTSFIGILVANLSPTKTAGTSATSMPSVVPMTTSTGSRQRDNAGGDEQGFHG